MQPVMRRVTPTGVAFGSAVAAGSLAYACAPASQCDGAGSVAYWDKIVRPPAPKQALRPVQQLSEEERAALAKKLGEKPHQIEGLEAKAAAGKRLEQAQLAKVVTKEATQEAAEDRSALGEDGKPCKVRRPRA